jgi:hypothetical protein
MDETIHQGINCQETDEASAWDEWETQEAINKAAIAKEHGFKPWAGFGPAAKSKTPPLSRAEQEESKARQQEGLQRWLNEGLPEGVSVATTPEEVPEQRPGNNPPVQAAGPQTAAEAVQEAVDTASSRPRYSRELNYRCRGYKTNDALANCNDINDKVRSTLAIINGLMSDKGFCYASDEQLAIWMHMSARGAKNLLNKLCRDGFIIHIGMSGENIKRVVRPDLSNNLSRTQGIVYTNRSSQPFWSYCHTECN